MWQSSRWFLDSITRHQVYLEGLKSGYGSMVHPYLKQLERDVKALVLDLEGEGIADLDKHKLEAFRRAVAKAFGRTWSPYLKEMDTALEELEKTEEKAWVFILGAAEKPAETEEKLAEPVEPEALPTKEEVNKWILEKEKEEDDKFIPFLSWAPWLQVLREDMHQKIQKLIIFANANNTPTKEFLAELKVAFDSLAKTNAATIGTIIQAISANTQHNLEKLLFKKYQWISVIDNRTSSICRMRNRMIFEYGKGPVPPAHPNCRSRIMPVLNGTVTTPESYYTWLKSQPWNVQSYILGTKKAKQLAEGSLKAENLTAFRNIRSLTLGQYEAKIKTVTK